MRKDVDVLIVGAGISGLGAAYHLSAFRPETSFAVLESQAGYGGTWRTHTYPGVRSDSDLYTFGYGFKPWKGKPIASAAQILEYLGEVIDENNLDQHIEYEHRIKIVVPGVERATQVSEIELPRSGLGVLENHLVERGAAASTSQPVTRCSGVSVLIVTTGKPLRSWGGGWSASLERAIPLQPLGDQCDQRYSAAATAGWDCQIVGVNGLAHCCCCGLEGLRRGGLRR
jgi:hypothetical protein